ncbi:hypothetical protein JXL21_06225, partial [Candidatus Bathyarchaeota archaeon]|nr:hypothetical protein [Candidatus Bathyarchaeota archaeon]
GIITPLMSLTRNLATSMSGVDLFERHPELTATRRAALMLTAVNVKTKSVRGPPFQYPLENPDDGSVKIRPDLWDDDEATRAFTKLREKGLDRTWVSATLPYLVVMTAGYVLSIVFGDVLLWLLILFTL